MSKRILVVAQCFYPENFRINNICLEWVKRGYKVTVLTGIPNYPQGAFYAGYGWFKKRKEDWHGIDIIRIPIIPRGKNSIMLVFNYISFMLSGLIWNITTKLEADIVFTMGLSPLTQALPAVKYAKKINIPCYIHVQDLWPENVILMTGIKNKHVLGLINKMMNYIYNECKLIFTASKSFITNIEKRGVDARKIKFWPQYAEDDYLPMKKTSIKGISHNALTVVFAGNIGYAQGLAILPKTAKILIDYYPNHNIQFIIIGNGRYMEKLIQEIKKERVEKYFHFIPQQPSSEIPRYLSACDVAFLSLTNSPVYEMTVPAKLQSHMACGIPTVAAASGETKQIIEESSSGICVNPGAANELAVVLAKLSKLPKEDILKMGINARAYYIENYQKDKLLDKMDEYFLCDTKVEGF